MMMMIKFVLTLVIVCFLGCASVSSTRLDLFSGDGRAELVQWAGYGEEKLSTVVIGGRLLCHSSAKNRSSSTPVSGSDHCSILQPAVFLINLSHELVMGFSESKIILHQLRTLMNIVHG